MLNKKLVQAVIGPFLTPCNSFHSGETDTGEPYVSVVNPQGFCVCHLARLGGRYVFDVEGLGAVEADTLEDLRRESLAMMAA